ncbi:MAG: MBL fold metallo-hydrolase [Prevotella sp.]|jgi:phosphoribosyl 1,2-cyclic phosphate phosphodiesterase|nr:MBL fold metallo-hydrolase [Prevotella sp.]
MKLTFLGTGTSCGVPVIGCQCEVCQSADPHDQRTRCSVLVETDETRLLIDCGPDFRQQILPMPFRKIDGILITHSHYDHVGGMDDIRPYCQFGEINVYADPVARKGMLEMLPYCFAENRYPGVPAIGLHEIHKHEPFRIGDLDIMPIEVMHGKLPILGYRIGKLAYITDMKTIEESEYPYLEGTELLVVNALRFTKPHHSHQLVDDALAFAHRVGAKQTLLIHVCHDIGLHESVNRLLPEGVQLAYDGQEVIL